MGLSMSDCPGYIQYERQDCFSFLVAQEVQTHNWQSELSNHMYLENMYVYIAFLSLLYVSALERARFKLKKPINHMVRVKCLFSFLIPTVVNFSFADYPARNTAPHVWNAKIKTICLPEEAWLAVNPAMCGLIPTHNIPSWLVLISFAQTLCRGPAVHF